MPGFKSSGEYISETSEDKRKRHWKYLTDFNKHSIEFLRWKEIKNLFSPPDLISLTESVMSVLLYEEINTNKEKNFIIEKLRTLHFRTTSLEEKDFYHKKLEENLSRFLVWSSENKDQAARDAVKDILNTNGSDGLAIIRSIYLRILLKEFIPKVIEYFGIKDTDILVSLPFTSTKQIRFPPHLKQAGISVLNYFSEIVESKYPNHQISITIQQNGLEISMIITSAAGQELETISETLTDYMQVIVGKLRPEELLDNKEDILKLQNKIELLTLEIKMNERQMLRDVDIINEQKKMIAALILQNERKEKELANYHKTLTEVISTKREDELMLLASLQDSIERLDSENASLNLKELKSNHQKVFLNLLTAMRDGVLGNKVTDWLNDLIRKVGI